MRKSKIFIILIMLFFSFIFMCNVKATDQGVDVKFTPSVDEIENGEIFTYNMSIVSRKSQDIATYRFTIEFDNSKLQYKGFEFDEFLDKSDFKYNVQDGKIVVIFLSESSFVYLKNGQEYQMFSVKFKSIENASLGNVYLNANIDGLANNNIESINVNSTVVNPVEIIAHRRSDCTLKSLSISEGKLSPNFSPLINNYTADVSSNVKQVEVYAEPNDDSAKVVVSRKTLGKIGSSTDIKVTVTSEDKKDSMIYYITVNRLEGESNTGTMYSSKSSGSKSSGSSKSPSYSSNNDTYDNADSNYIADGDASKILDDDPGQILVKSNRFLPFLIGVLIALCLYGAYAIYEHKIKKK